MTRKTRSTRSSPGQLAGDRAVAFFEQVLVHTKGRFGGHPFLLADWQRDGIIRPLFGTLRKDGLRQYRTAYVELGRKNGKSELGAGIALLLLTADGEQGAEVYSAATDRDQATIVFHVAAEMVRRSRHLSSLCRVIDSQKRIIVPSTGSVYRAIPADAAGSHGFNASAVVFDELHAQPNRDLWDVLATSTAAREQPLMFAITTAGFDRTSICWELHEYAERVAAGVVDDPTFFGYIRSLPEDADWTDEALWHIANPALEGAGGGDFRSLEELRTAVAQARERPAYENTVRRLYMSQWTRSDVRWLPLAAWDACGGIINEADLHGRQCWAGLDLGSTSDFTALVYVFPHGDGATADGYDVVCRFWLPEAALQKRSPMRPQLEAWERAGFLQVTEGNATDYRAIQQQILADAEVFDIQEVGYDPWHGTQTVIELAGEGLTMVPVRQGFLTLTDPSQTLETLVARGVTALNHGGHPVLRWMADNCMAETNAAGGLKPSKNKSTEKIDGIAALVTALERATHAARDDSVLLYVAGSESEAE
jgi:phage terminase large subunit-like protein